MNPSSRPSLQGYNESVRGRIQGRLDRLGWSWHRLAQEVADNGISCKATISHWGSGRNAQIGSSVYVAVTDILDAAEAQAARRIRIRAKGGAS